jgi:hypothetical protein
MASRDYEEFIVALNHHGVRYLIVGAHAVAFHARPRATKDLDLLLEPTRANARRTLAALRDFFGGVDLGYTVADLMDPRWIIQLGVAPIRIDLHSNFLPPSVAGHSEQSRFRQRRISLWLKAPQDQCLSVVAAFAKAEYYMGDCVGVPISAG